MITWLTTILDWIDSKDFNLGNYSNDSPIGCFMEVDLEYSDEPHDLHSDCPLAGEKIVVTEKCCLIIKCKS